MGNIGISYLWSNIRFLYLMCKKHASTDASYACPYAVEPSTKISAMNTQYKFIGKNTVLQEINLTFYRHIFLLHFKKQVCLIHDQKNSCI